MLVEFNVTNYHSVRETQSLKMTADRISELRDNCFTTGLNGMPDLLRSAVVYGPNASGKSNLVKAIRFMRNFVISSSKQKQEGDPIPVVPFLLDRQNRSLPSEFEVIFIQDKIRYQYGFSVTSERVVHEWLFAYPEGRAQRWFERQYNGEHQEEWYFGPKFTGGRKLWKNATRGNALFLSSAIQLNSEQLKPVFKWFFNLAVVTSPIDEGFTIGHLMKSDDKKQKIINFMTAADLSISDIHVEQTLLEDLPPEKVPDELKEFLNNKDADVIIKTGRVSLNFLHPSDAGELVPLDFKFESAGTRKLFAFAYPWLEMLENGRILIIDEFDISLHPLIVRFLIELINNPLKNKKNAQLIFTTHDTTILDRELFRRDQVWFVEKDESNATQLYPLTDFKPRKGEIFQKGYLQGRYGALPFIGELSL